MSFSINADEKDYVQLPVALQMTSTSDAPFKLRGAEQSPIADGPLLANYRSQNDHVIRKDFTTIDWYFSNWKHMRQDLARKKLNIEQRGLRGRLENAFYAVQGWIILLAVGVAIAINALAITWIAKWLRDVRLGYCSLGWWNPRDVCCADMSLLSEGCIQWVTWSELIHVSNSAGAYTVSYIAYVLFSVLFAWLAYLLVSQFSAFAGGSGIPECTVILGGFVIKGVLGIRALFIKTVALSLSVSSGLAVGKEGPLVHIGCCWGNILSRPFAKYKFNEVKKREIISASAAAGVAAAFGSPMGGVLFSLESVSTYFPPKTMWRSFWACVSSVLFLKYLDPFGTGRMVEFQVDYSNDWKWFELFIFAFVGVLGGLMGGAFVRLHMRIMRWKRARRWARHQHELLLVIFIAAIVNYPVVFLRGSMPALMADLFSDCMYYDPSASDDIDPAGEGVFAGLCGEHTATYLALLIFAALVRLLCTVVSFGLKVPAGVFIPTMAFGACMGRVVGWLIYIWHERVGDVGLFAVCEGDKHCINMGAYAVVGAAAALCGVTRLTVSLSVIMFELTGGLTFIVPITVGLVTAKWAADFTIKGGIYDHLITFKGYPFISSAAEPEFLDSAPICDVMTPNPVALTTYGMTLAQLNEFVEQNAFHGFPIVDSHDTRIVSGFITRTDLLNCLAKANSSGVDPITPCHFSPDPPADDAQKDKERQRRSLSLSQSPEQREQPPTPLDFSADVDQFPIRVLPNTPADRVLSVFRAVGLAFCLVCSATGSLQGIVKKKDLLHYLHERDADAKNDMQ